MAPPPVHVPSSNLARNHEWNAGIADGVGEGAGTGAEGFVPPVSRPWGRASGASGCRRGRSAQVREQGPAILDNNFQPDDNIPAPRVPVQMPVPSIFMFCLLADLMCSMLI